MGWHGRCFKAAVMRCVEQEQTTKAESTAGEIKIHLPSGLLGFESYKDYVLLGSAGEEPFFWLQVANQRDLAFLAISPFQIAPDYAPDVSKEDLRFVGLEELADAFIFNLVTIRGPGQATLNLKGPIILNRQTRTGKQVVPLNAVQFSVQHPLPIAEA